MAQTEEHLRSPLTVRKPHGTPVTVFLSQSTHQFLRKLASEHERSLSGELRWVLKRYSDYPAAFDEQ